MAHQKEFTGWTARAVRPDPSHLEPLLWVREVSVFKEFSPHAVLKTFRLHPGMNIIWARPYSGPVSLGQSGLSGHAAGKTTFCRILRYMLGEKHVGTNEFRDSLCERFPNAVIAAEVRLAGEEWLVCRSPGVAGKEFARKGAGLASLFIEDRATQPYKAFVEAVNRAVLPGLSSLEMPSRQRKADWSFILPWLTRDQECRYARLLVWRRTESDSDAPETPARDAAYLVRSISGLVSADEEVASAKHENLKDEEHDLSELQPKLEYRLQVDKERIRTAMSSMDGLGGELFYDALVGRIDAELAVSAGHRDRLPEAKTAQDAENEADALRRDLMAAEQSLANSKRDLTQQRCHLAALRQGKQDATDDAWLRSGDPQPGDKCGVPLRIALQTCRLAQQYNAIDFTSAKAFESVEKNIPLWESQVAAMERYVQDEESGVINLRTSLAGAEAKRNAARICLREAERVAVEQEERLRALRRQTTQLQESEELRQRTMARLELVRKQIRVSSERLDDMRKFLKERLSELSTLFQDILQAVIGQEVTTAIIPQAEEIRLTVNYHGSRTSAATETIKILAFDIACMLLSIEGHGGHPRFLVHDSPREADMSRDIYHRFFLYMRGLEQQYLGNASPSFQYIITTTEKPPDGLCAEPWLVAELDAATPKGRLLGVDL